MWNIKPAVLEPRNSNDFQQVLEEFEHNIVEYSGSIFFAVCRGKISEGINFSDKKARAVIIVGIPFSPIRDPKVCYFNIWKQK